MLAYGEKFFKDGHILSFANEGSVPLSTHGLHYGVGAFEGVRAYRRESGETVVFRLSEHVTRLFDTCRLTMLKPELGQADVEHGCVAVLRENALVEAYLRPLVVVGAGGMGLWSLDNPVHTYVMGFPWGAYLGKEGLERGIRCQISSLRRQHLGAGYPRGKITGQYVTSVMAKQEAKLAGFDEALLTDEQGHVCEGSGENLFVVKDGRLVTPPLSASILAGITRDTVIVLAREADYVVEQRPLLRDDVYLADEVFLTGTAAEITPVREVDHRSIGGGGVGPVTKELQTRFFDIVRGRDDSHPEWLTRV